MREMSLRSSNNGASRRPSSQVQRETRLPGEESFDHGVTSRSHGRSSASAQRVEAVPNLSNSSSRDTYTSNQGVRQQNSRGKASETVPVQTGVLKHTSNYGSSYNGASSCSRDERSTIAAPTGRVWRSAVDPKTGRTYYYDVITRETQWRKPLELATDEERYAMAKKEKKQKDFFAAMEQNILRNLQQGSFMPTTKHDDEARDSVGHLNSSDFQLTQTIDKTSRANPKLERPKAAVRTISQMDHTDILELARRPSSQRHLVVDKENSGQVANQNQQNNDKDASLLGRRISPRDVMNVPDASEASWFAEEGDNKEHQAEDCAWFDCDSDDVFPGIDRKESDFSVSSDSSDESADRAILEIEKAAATMAIDDSPPPVPTSKSESPTIVNKANNKAVEKPALQKRNTCGTLYVSSTMSAPDKDATIKCVCGVFRAHLRQSLRAEEQQNGTKLSFEEYEIFNDIDQFGLPAGESVTYLPSLDEITNFYRDVFRKAQMESDCIIMSLVYVERLIKDTNGGVRPHPRNWRSILFSSMILSSKVWDDLSMWNADFSQCVSAREAGISFSIQRINELERAMLSCLNYNVKVAASEYAKYYFLLRSMVIRSGLGSDNLNALSPLDVEGARQLELRSTNLSVVPNSGASKPNSVMSPTLEKPRNRRIKSCGHVDNTSHSTAGKEELRSPTTVRATLEQIIPM